MGVIIAQNADPDNGLSHVTRRTAHEMAGVALRHPWASTALPHRPMLQRSAGRFAGNHTTRQSGFVVIFVALTSRFHVLLMRAAARAGTGSRLFAAAPALARLLLVRLAAGFVIAVRSHGRFPYG